VGDFRKLWRTIVKKAGIERDVLIHDFRRSAVSNMIERGVDRDVAKMISGHKTDSMLTRYNIGRESKVIAALAQIEAGKQQERELAKQATVGQPTPVSGPLVGHDGEFEVALDSLEVAIN